MSLESVRKCVPSSLATPVCLCAVPRARQPPPPFRTKMSILIQNGHFKWGGGGSNVWISQGQLHNSMFFNEFFHLVQGDIIAF